MFLLPDELFKNRGKTFIISFGEPIPWSRFDRTKQAGEWADMVKNEVYQLANKSNK